MIIYKTIMAMIGSAAIGWSGGSFLKYCTKWQHLAIVIVVTVGLGASLGYAMMLGIK